MISPGNIAVTALIWGAYVVFFLYLARKGKGHDAAVSGRVGFVIQALAYVATYISAVALVGFGGLAHAYGMQMLLVAAGNVVLGVWFVYRFLAWPTKQWQERLGARSPAVLLGLGHHSPLLGRVFALVFAVLLGVYASAVIKGAALLLAPVLPLPLWTLVWLVAVIVGACVYLGGLRGVLYTEAMQGVIMLAGIVLIIGAVFKAVGGPLQGLHDLAALPPTPQANNGLTSLSGGGPGLFVLSLVVVTSVAVWAQPQMMQRHFAVHSKAQIARTTPLAMLILTVLVGGTYFAAALSRLIIPEVSNPDLLMPELVQRLLPAVGLQLFVLAVVSASLSTATALFHIAALSVAEDVPGTPSTPPRWAAGIIFCVLVSALCAQSEGRLIAMLCTTSWSIVGAMALVPYVALVRFGQRNARAAWLSAGTGFVSCLAWYLLVYRSTAVVPSLFPSLTDIPPFFVGLALSLAGWALGAAVRVPRPEEASLPEA